MSDGATWWWVRHGPTHERAFLGWRDVPADLSDRAALDRLSDYLPDDALVVASTLSRARATADAIQGRRRRLSDAPDLREFSFGTWDGLTFDQVAAAHPELSRTYWEAPGDVRPPGGESWNDVAVRVAPFVDRINQDHAGAQVIAVAHIGVILTQLQRVTGQTAVNVIAQKIDNLSVTRLSYGTGGRAGPINHIP